jgi:hypothetical protein
MSEINRGIPEGVTQKATIINFEAAKGRRLEAETRQAKWIQERTQKQPLTDVEAATPGSAPVTSEAYQSPQSGRRVEFTKKEGEVRENRLPAENTNNIIDIQKARETRFLNEQPDSGVLPESNTFNPLYVKQRPG